MFEKTNVKFLCGASFVLGCSITLLVFSLALAYCVHNIRSAASIFARSKAEPQLVVSPARISACGILEPIEIPLVDPEGAIPDEPERLRQSKWTFDNFTEAGLVKFFSGCELQPVQRRLLLDRSCWTFASNSIIVAPSEQLVWSLSPSTRARIYSVLGKSTANYSQNLPFRFPP